MISLAFSLWTYQNQKCTFKFIEQIILDGHPACMEVLLPVLWPIHTRMTHNYTKLGAKQNMNWDSTRIVLNWIRLSTLSAWIYTVFPSMLHTLNFTSTQLWSKFTSLPLPDLSCLSHSCTPGFLRMLTWGQWLSPWRLILQAIVVAVRPKLWNRPSKILI